MKCMFQFSLQVSVNQTFFTPVNIWGITLAASAEMHVTFTQSVPYFSLILTKTRMWLQNLVKLQNIRFN